MKKYKFEIQNPQGETISRHNTYAAAEKRYLQSLDWRCALCGLVWKGGWSRCEHGIQNQICSEECLKNKIVRNY